MGVYRQDFYHELAHCHPPSPFYQIVISPLCLRHVPCPHRPFPCGGGAVADDFAINLRVVTFEWVVLLCSSPSIDLRNVLCPHRPFPCDGGTVADGDTTNSIGVVLLIAQGCRR